VNDFFGGTYVMPTNAVVCRKSAVYQLCVHRVSEDLNCKLISIRMFVIGITHKTEQRHPIILAFEMIPSLRLDWHNVTILGDEYIFIDPIVDIADHMDVGVILDLFLIGFVDRKQQLVIFAAV